MNVPTLYWRLFELRDGELYTLFHGVNGSRLIRVGHWYQAERKRVRDGNGDNWYESGFHVFADDKGLEYTKRFTAPRQLLAVLVAVDGEIRTKPTNDRILLVDRMKVPAGTLRRPVL